MKIISLGAIALMIQPIFSFCVYNDMDGNTQFYIKQVMDLPIPFSIFQAVLNPGGKSCCHYSNADCSPSGKASDNASFKAEFSSGHQILASCETGGEISFHGTIDNPTVICTKSDGSAMEIGIGN